MIGRLSVEEACSFLDCSEPRLLELLRSGMIPAFKPGRAWVIPSAPFLAAVNELAVQAAFSIRKETSSGKVVKPRLPRT